jgi:hypothetical protein
MRQDIPLRCRSGRPWKPVFAIIAAYALVLQTLLLGIAGASQAARSAEGSFPICLTHEGPATPAPSDVPNRHSDCTAICVLCAGAVNAVALPPLGASLRFVSAAGDVVRWRRPEWVVLAPFDNPVAQPRGPPLAA